MRSGTAAALFAAAALGIGLLVVGAAEPGVDRAPRAQPRPLLLHVQAVEIDPRTGTVEWSTGAGPSRVVLDPTTGRTVTP